MSQNVSDTNCDDIDGISDEEYLKVREEKEKIDKKLAQDFKVYQNWVENTEEELKSEKDRLSSLEKEHNEILSKLEVLDVKIETLDSEMKKQEDVIKTLSEDLERQRKVISKQMEELSKLDLELKRVEDELERTKLCIDELRQEESILQNRLKVLLEQISSLDDQGRREDEKIEELAVAVRELSSYLDRKKIKLRESREQFLEIDRKIEENERLIHKTNLKKKELQHEYEKSVDELEYLKGIERQISEQIIQLEKAAEKITSENGRLSRFFQGADALRPGGEIAGMALMPFCAPAGIALGVLAPIVGLACEGIMRFTKGLGEKKVQQAEENQVRVKHLQDMLTAHREKIKVQEEIVRVKEKKNNEIENRIKGMEYDLSLDRQKREKLKHYRDLQKAKFNEKKTELRKLKLEQHSAVYKKKYRDIQRKEVDDRCAEVRKELRMLAPKEREHQLQIQKLKDTKKSLLNVRNDSRELVIDTRKKILKKQEELHKMSKEHGNALRERAMTEMRKKENDVEWHKCNENIKRTETVLKKKVDEMVLKEQKKNLRKVKLEEVINEYKFRKRKEDDKRRQEEEEKQLIVKSA